MNKISELRSKTVSVLQSTINLAKEYELGEKEKKLNIFAERLRRGRTVVVVCGEFKRGKSSFINALIEEPELCPVDIDITTNMATQIQYSMREYVRIHFNKSTGKSPIIVGRDDIPKYVTEQENKENKNEIQFVEIGIPKEKLNKNFMVIVDTPGVGSLNAKHSEVTAAYLSVADVLLYVCDATSPLTTIELEFIKRASKYCSNIYFILTKIDAVRGWKQIEGENRKKIANCLGKREELINIFPVSSLNKLDFIKTGDEESLEDSKFNIMEEKLQRDLSSSIAKNILLKPLIIAKSDVSEIKKSLTIQHQAIQKGTLEKKKSIEEKLVEINDQYKSLQKSNSKWQLIFGDSSLEIKRKMRKALNDGFLSLEKDIKEKIKDVTFRSNPETVNSYIKNNVIDILKDADDLLSDEINEIQGRISELIGKEIDIVITDSTDLEVKEVDDKVFKDQRDSGEKLRDLGRNVSMNTASFTAVGMLAGGAILGIVGTMFGVGVVAAMWGYKTGGILGGVIGGVFGAKNHTKEVSKKQEVDIMRTCIEVLKENRGNCLELVDAEITQVLSQIRNNFYTSIQESMETVERTRNEISKHLNLNTAEVNAKLQKLQDSIKNMNILENNINALMLEVQNL